MTSTYSVEVGLGLSDLNISILIRTLLCSVILCLKDDWNQDYSLQHGMMFCYIITVRPESHSMAPYFTKLMVAQFCVYFQDISISQSQCISVF
jgi:hypothetical protein